MGKRSKFKRIDKDYYATWDPRAMPPWFVHHIYGYTYAEPCCGEGDLIRLLDEKAHTRCEWRSDIEKRGAGVVKDGLDLTFEDVELCSHIITNPPYKRDVLLPLLDHFVSLRDTWLLLPSDLMHNKYFVQYMKYCDKIVSVGRLKWVKDSPASSKDNYCWYKWNRNFHSNGPARFYPRG